MTAVTVFLIIFAICAFLLLAYAIWWNESLDEWQEELDKYSVHLDERANRIAADEATLTGEWKALQKAKEEIGRDEK